MAAVATALTRPLDLVALRARARRLGARLTIELTESAIVQDPERTTRALQALKGLNVRVAMDDFGTGYSSLSYLRSFPFDKIKIDRSFVSDLEQRHDSQLIDR